MPGKWLRIGVALVGMGMAAWLLLFLFTGSVAAAPITSPPTTGEQGITAAATIGEPCGSGELLPPWVICLHGTITQVDSAGQATPLAGIPLTITRGSLTVSGVTFVHRGQSTPSYGIDISPLQPTFLQPVTLTALISGHLVQRQVTVFPNFATQNQQFDLQMQAVGALDPAPVWGYVIDFANHGPVSGATVTADYQGRKATVTTVQTNAAEPIYTLDSTALAAIGASSGSVITVTAQYNGDVDQRLVLLRDTPTQVDFVTGWKCDDFDPLPQSGGKFGLPQSGGKFGLPDAGCLWGYGLVDGVPTAGMTVQAVISGTVYEAKTKFFPGEALPRYGIGVWGAEELTGHQITTSGVYSGFTTTNNEAISLGPDLAQRIDLRIKSVVGLNSFTNSNGVSAVTWENGHVWIASDGGVVRLNPLDGSYTKFTTSDGLSSNRVKNVAVDSNGNIWFGFGQFGVGVSRYSPSSGQWRTFTPTDGLSNSSVNAIATDKDGGIWFGTTYGVSHYLPSAGKWRTYTTVDGLASMNVQAITVDANRNLWFAFSQSKGVSRYTPNTGQWRTFTTATGLANNDVRAVTMDHDGNIWFGTYGNGLSRYTPNTEVWINYTTSHGLVSNAISSITVDHSGTIWFGAEEGIGSYKPSSGEWKTYKTNRVSSLVIDEQGSLWLGTDKGINRYTIASATWQTYDIIDSVAGNNLSSIVMDKDGNLWMGIVERGVSRYAPDTKEWRTYTITDGLAHNYVTAISTDQDGGLWFGTFGAGVSHYSPRTGAWHTYTIADGLTTNFISAVKADKRGNIWFGTSGAGVSRYSLSTGTWQSYTQANGIRTIEEDKDGNIWFGTGAGGVVRYAPNTGIWQTYTVTDGLGSNNVEAIAIDAEGNIWFGTEGVSRYTPRTGIWQTYTTIDGLSHNSVHAIAIDTNGNLWFGTNAGVSYYSPKKDVWRTYTSSDGLANAWVYSIVIDRQDTLWIGTIGEGVSQLQVAPLKSDLSLQMISTPRTLPGSLVTYTVTIVNQGELDAPATLMLTLPNGIIYQSATLPSFAPLSWNLGTLATGGSPTTVIVTTTIDTNLSPNTMLTAKAVVTTTVPEEFLANNTAQVTTHVGDPNHADVRASLTGAPILIPNQIAIYTLWIDNIGGLAADNTRLTVTPAPQLTYQSDDPLPTSLAPLTWDLGSVPASATPRKIKLALQVAANTPPNTDLTVTAQLVTTTQERETANNHATVTIPTSRADAKTLILVAPERLAARYGASSLPDRLYRLANHPQVQGVILDVLTDPAVQAAYQTWDANPGDPQRANGVAVAIKALIDQYTTTYPDLHYLLLVGGDELIPFYRSADQNRTPWRERSYAGWLPSSAVRMALLADQILTDDFYADRAATIPASPYWLDRHPLFVPDFAIGRLVETPAEMSAAIDAFLAADGRLQIDAALVGTDEQLTADLGRAQCDLLQSAGLTSFCNTDREIVSDHLLNQQYTSYWLAQHSNHLAVGGASADAIYRSTLDFNNRLLVTIGCHAGLNVPTGDGPLPDRDFVQTFLGRGGTMIGATAYTYASSLNTGYSEALAQALTTQLLTGAPTLGDALVRAKQQYFASRANWFDYLDEKVLLPVTLYGLPMVQVTAPRSLTAPATAAQLPSPLVKLSDATAASTAWQGGQMITYTLHNLTFARHDSVDGAYYTYQGHTLAQDGLPIQPAWQEALPPLPTGETARGVVLRAASYHDESGFQPFLAQSRAIGEPPAPAGQAMPAWQTGWDREYPYALGHFVGLSTTVTSLNLALGAYAADTQHERLFSSLTLAVTYSHSDDLTPPTFHSAAGYTTNEGIVLQAKATDQGPIAHVYGICDDGQGHWSGIQLTATGGLWSGLCSAATVRFYIQAVDSVGNVARSAWATPFPTAPPAQPHILFLPLVAR